MIALVTAVLGSLVLWHGVPPSTSPAGNGCPVTLSEAVTNHNHTLLVRLEPARDTTRFLHLCAGTTSGSVTHWDVTATTPAGPAPEVAVQRVRAREALAALTFRAVTRADLAVTLRTDTGQEIHFATTLTL